MTRKHFILLASVLRDLRPDPKDVEDFRTWNSAVRAVSNMCKDVNGRFDERRFRDACAM